MEQQTATFGDPVTAIRALGAKLGGLFTNLKAKPSAPAAVTFEFLNGKGDVIASQKQDVPVIEASGNHAFDLKVTGAGIVAWRYRKS